MKLKIVKTPLLRFSRCAVIVSVCVLLCASLARVGAQRAHRRITSVWTATSVEGSRVTLASDTDLNDYEAYTRGDRFYVRIPLADLPSTTGSLLGRGFDDVQIHRVGDGILLSFRLQPGSIARVDHKVNRLEVVFSIPARSQNAVATAARNEAASRPRVRRIADTAGPAPPVSTRESQTASRSAARHAERAARATEGNSSTSTKSAGESHRGAVRNSKGDRQPPAKENGEKGSASSAARGSATPAVKAATPSVSPTPTAVSASKSGIEKGAGPSASPISSPPPVASPSAAVAAASPSSTLLTGPATTASASPAASPTPAVSDAGKIDWPSRLHYYKEWIRLNPIPLAIAAGVFAVLLLLLFVRGGRNRLRVVLIAGPSKSTPTFHATESTDYLALAIYRRAAMPKAKIKFYQKSS